MKIKEFGPGTRIPAPFGSATAIVIVCKRSLGQGNVLHLCVILVTVGGGGPCPSMHHRSYDRGFSVQWGISVQGVSVPCAKIDSAAVCCLQFSLLFAVCKMSLFCTEINYSLMCSLNNKYLFKQINMVSFTQRNTSCTF